MRSILIKMRSLFSRAYIRYPVTLIFWLCVWEAASLSVGKTILLPSPYETLTAMVTLFSEGKILYPILMTFVRISLGFISGGVIGIILAVLTSFSDFFDALLSPVRSIIKSTPVASFILLLYLWLSQSRIPGFIAALMVIPIFWGNVSSGIKAVDVKSLEVAKVFGFGVYQKLKYIYIPSLSRFFTAALHTGAGLSFKSGVAAEALVRTKDSLGGMLFDAKADFESEKLFAVTAVIIILSAASEAVIARLCEKNEKKEKTNARTEEHLKEIR